MTRHLEQIGRLIRAAETQGPARFVTGVTTADPTGGRIAVDVGSRVVPATIPGSFRAALAAGQDVRLSVQGMLYTIDSVLSPLDAPATGTADNTAIPSAPTRPAHFLDAGYSVSGFTVQDEQNAAYANYLADRLVDADVAIDSLRHAMSDAMTIINRLQAALAAQGHIT